MIRRSQIKKQYNKVLLCASALSLLLCACSRSKFSNTASSVQASTGEPTNSSTASSNGLSDNNQTYGPVAEIQIKVTMSCETIDLWINPKTGVADGSFNTTCTLPPSQATGASQGQFMNCPANANALSLLSQLNYQKGTPFSNCVDDATGEGVSYIFYQQTEANYNPSTGESVGYCELTSGDTNILHELRDYYDGCFSQQ